MAGKIGKMTDAIGGSIKSTYRSGVKKFDKVAGGGYGKAQGVYDGYAAKGREYGDAAKASYADLRSKGRGDIMSKLTVGKDAALMAPGLIPASGNAAIGGAVAGGAYGASSDNTSVLGGMAAGGLAGFGAVKGGKAMHKRYGT